MFVELGQAPRGYHLSLELFAVFYFPLSICISWLWPIPAIQIPFSAVSLFLIPLVVGKAAVTFVFKGHKGNYSTFISSFIIEWIIGFLVVYFSAAILSEFNLLNSQVFTLCILLLPLIYLNLIQFRRNSEQPTFNLGASVRKAFGNKLVIPLIVIAGILPLLYLIPVLPYPLAMTQTGGRLLLSLQFINGGTMDLLHGYAAILSPVQSLSAIVYNIHPLQVLSTTPYFMYILFPFSIYLLSYKLTNDPVLSLVPTFIAPWAFLGGSANLTTLENANMLFLVFPWLLYAGLDSLSSFPQKLTKVSKPWLLVSIAIIFLSPITYLLGRGGSVIPPVAFVFLSIFLPVILISLYLLINRGDTYRLGILTLFILPFMLLEILHPYLGTLLVFFTFCFFWANSISKSKSLKLLRLLTVVLLVTPLVLVLLDVNGLNNFIFSSGIFGMNNLQGTASDLTIQQKWYTFLDFGPNLMVYLFIFLTVAISVFGQKKYLPFTFASTVMLFVTFLPDGNLWRSQGFINPLFAIMLGYGVIVLWTYLRKLVLGPLKRALIDHKSKIQNKSYKIPGWLPKVLFVVIILAIFLPIVETPKINYYYNTDFSLSGEGYFSYFQTYDVQTSYWILNNYKTDDVLIISDPATMYYVGSLTAMKTLWTQYIDPFPTSIYPNSTWAYMDRLKNAFLTLGENGSSISILNVASEIYQNPENRTILIIINSHTHYWLYQNNIFPTRIQPLSVNSIPIVTELNGNYNLSCVYQYRDSSFVFKVDR
jgi:hypothetical protein